MNEYELADFIAEQVKTKCVGRKCAPLSYCGGILFEDNLTSSASHISFDWLVTDASFSFSSVSIPDSYASTPSYDLYLMVKNIKDGTNRMFEANISDVL